MSFQSSLCKQCSKPRLRKMAECADARGKEREMTEYRVMADEEERKMIEDGRKGGRMEWI